MKYIKSFFNNKNNYYLIIFIFCILSNVVVHGYLMYQHGDGNIKTTSDGRKYLEIANSIRHFSGTMLGNVNPVYKGQDIGDVIMPGYPLFISPFFENLHLISLFQVILLCFGLFYLFKVLINKYLKVFTLINLIWIIFSTSWDYHNQPLIESPTISLLLIIIYFLDRYFKDYQLKDFVWFSIFFGILISINNRYIFHFSGFLPFLLILKYFERRIKIKHLFYSFLIVTAILAPWHIRQYVAYNELMLFSPSRSKSLERANRKDSLVQIYFKIQNYKNYLLDPLNHPLKDNPQELEEARLLNIKKNKEDQEKALAMKAAGIVKHSEPIKIIFEPNKEMINEDKSIVLGKRKIGNELIAKRQEMLGFKPAVSRNEGNWNQKSSDVKIVKYDASSKNKFKNKNLASNKNSSGKTARQNTITKNTSKSKKTTLKQATPNMQLPSPQLATIIQSSPYSQRILMSIVEENNIAVSDKSVKGILYELQLLKNSDSIKYNEFARDLIQLYKERKEKGFVDTEKKDVAVTKQIDTSIAKPNISQNVTKPKRRKIYIDSLRILMDQLELSLNPTMDSTKLTKKVIDTSLASSTKQIAKLDKNHDSIKELSDMELIKQQENYINRYFSNRLRPRLAAATTDHVIKDLVATEIAKVDKPKIVGTLSPKIADTSRTKKPIHLAAQINKSSLDTQIVISKIISNDYDNIANVKPKRVRRVATDTLVIIKNEITKSGTKPNESQITYDTLPHESVAEVVSKLPAKIKNPKVNYQDQGISITMSGMKVEQIKVSDFDNELEFRKFENLRIRKMVPTYDAIIDALLNSHPKFGETPEKLQKFLSDFSYSKYKQLVYEKFEPSNKYELIWNRFKEQFIFYRTDFRLTPQWDPRIYWPSHYNNLINWGLELIMVPLILINIIPLFIAIYKKDWLIISLAVLVLLHILLHALVGYIPRYRITIYPVWITFAVYGYDQITRYIIYVYKNRADFKRRIYDALHRNPKLS